MTSRHQPPPQPHEDRTLLLLEFPVAQEALQLLHEGHHLRTAVGAMWREYRTRIEAMPCAEGRRGYRLGFQVSVQWMLAGPDAEQ